MPRAFLRLMFRLDECAATLRTRHRSSSRFWGMSEKTASVIGSGATILQASDLSIGGRRGGRATLTTQGRTPSSAWLS